MGKMGKRDSVISKEMADSIIASIEESIIEMIEKKVEQRIEEIIDNLKLDVGYARNEYGSDGKVVDITLRLGSRILSKEILHLPVVDRH